MENFLKELEAFLNGNISEHEIASNVEYYRAYIKNQKNMGKAEKDILEELGPARFIARSIIDADAISGKIDNSGGVYQETNDYTYNSTSYDSEDVRTDDKANKPLIFSGGCIIAVVLLVLLLVLIFILKIFIWVLPIALIVMFLMYIFGRNNS